MNSTHFKILFFLFLVVFLFVHHFFGYLGHYGYDDMEYAQLAKQWADGNFHLSNNHFSYRWSIVGLTGISYYLFGMSDFASAIPSLLVSILTLFLVFWMTRKKSVWISVIAMSLFALNQWSLFYSDKIMPDLYIALAVFGAIASYWSYRFDYVQKFTFLHAFFFTGFLLMGFLTKETVLLIAPVLLFVAIYDFIQKINLKFWIYSILIGGAMLLFYFILIKIKTGNIWMRFDAIAINSYVNPCSYDLLPISEVLSRISYKYWFEMIGQVMLIGFVFLIPAISVKNFRDFLKMKDENSFLVVVAMVTLVAANFMTINFKAYVPMCVDVRHYLYVIPLMAVAFAPYVEKFFINREGRYSIPLLAFIMTFIAFFQGFITAMYFFIPFTIICLIRAFIKTEIGKGLQKFLLFLFIASLLILPITRMFEESAMCFRDINPMVKKHFFKSQSKNIVFTDLVLKRISDYYMQYDTLNTRFISYYDIKNMRLKGNESVYVLINDYTTYVTSIKKDSVPLFIREFEKQKYALEDSTQNMKLYKVIDRKVLLIKEKEVNVNYDMEFDSLKGWNINPLSLVNDKAQSGKRSNLVNGGGYSVTLVKPLKELANDSTFWVNVSVSFSAFLSEKIDAKIVVSLETIDGKSLQWLGKDITKDIKTFGQWGKIIYNNRFNLPKDAVNNAIFKIFVWNDQAKPIYIDDFIIKFECINHL